MKKLFTHIIIVLTLVFSLSGCYPNKPMYNQEDANSVTSKGAEMMQAWLDENMTDAKLEECEAFITWTNYDGNNYLTDYASGKLSKNGKQTSFTINTVTGALYFEPDDETKQKMDKVVEAYFDEALKSIGIVAESVDEGRAFKCHVMAPARDGDSITEIPWTNAFDFGIPAGVKDLDSYVRNPQTRLPIYISTPEISVSSDTNLSAYDLAAIEALNDKYGLCVGEITMQNTTQFFNMAIHNNQKRALFMEYGCWLKSYGFELHGRVHVREEKKDCETNELTVSDLKFTPETDLIFEKTDYGYCWSFLNENWPDDSSYGFTIVAEKGAEILNNDYYNVNEKPTDERRQTVWLEREDGSYVLASAKNGSSLHLCEGEKLIRID